MALLGSRALLIGVAASVGCYDPALRDCVVECSASIDCGPSQICRAGMCAAPDVTCDGREPGATPDGGAPPGRPPQDAAMVDAARPVDAPPQTPPAHPLVVRVTGAGRVEIDGVGTCRDECGYDVPPGPRRLRAIADDDARLDKWQDACAQSTGDTCLLVIVAPVTAGVKFTDD